MTLFTSLGLSADCRGLTQVPIYQVRTGHTRWATFSVSQRGFLLGWGLQGKVARTPHQSKGSGGTVWAGVSGRRLAEYEVSKNLRVRGQVNTDLWHVLFDTLAAPVTEVSRLSKKRKSSGTPSFPSSHQKKGTFQKKLV
jgi:hypothetical protein